MSGQKEFGEQDIASMLKIMEEAKKHNEQARQAYLAQDYRFFLISFFQLNYFNLVKLYSFITVVCLVQKLLFN